MCVVRQANNFGRMRDLLIDPLMRVCLIEKRAILTDDTPHMVFTRNHLVIQAFAAHTTDEHLANRIGLGGSSILARSPQKLIRGKIQALCDLAIVVTDDAPYMFR